MHDFVPPFPERPRQPLSAFATLRLARRNFLAIWEERCFEWEVFSTRMLSRTLFVCNSPDTVASAFVEHHDSFERKSPQMRHGLAPLLGDGLFISDGETWRRRRRIVAPIVHVSHLPLFAPLMVQAAGETAERLASLPRDMPINALTEMATLTAEIICRTVFGRQLGAEHAAEIVAAFSEYQRLVGQLDLAYFFGLPDWMPRFHSPAVHRSAKRIHKVLEQVIGDCRERLSGGVEITYHGRRGYHLRVTRGDSAAHEGPTMFYPADAIVDAETLAVSARIATGKGPWAVVAGP